MKTIYNKIILVAVICICIFSLATPVYAAQQGTNGDELQVIEPAQLEIQLGPNWSGVEFQMKTDAGIYPDIIAVGNDGILRLEIGGSSEYILSCMNSSVSVPKPDGYTTSSESTQTPATTESNISSSADEGKSESSGDGTVADIPTKHLVFFIVGMILAIGSLIMIHMTNKKRENIQNEDVE